MKLHFIGTRGYIEESSRYHKNRSSLLVESEGKKLLIDFGDLYEPEELPKADYYINTHSHPDHLFGFKKVKALESPLYISELTVKSAYYKDEDYSHLPIKVYRVNRAFKLGPFTIRAVEILHSTKAPNVALFISDGRHKICYASDVVSILKAYRDKYLKGCDIYIGDLSTYRGPKSPLIRKSKTDEGTLIGHTSPHTQLAWCRDANVPVCIFTHLGKECVEMGDRKLYSKLKPLEDKYGVKIIIAKDGDSYDVEELLTMSERELLQLKPIDVEAITPKMFPSIEWAMYIVPRHAKLIYDGEKTLIIKAREYKSHIDEPLFLIDNKLAYGIIYLQEPREISIEEFKSLRDRHRITDKELEEWWGKRDKLYAYEFKFVKFPVPKPIRAPKGAQTFVKASNIKFLTPKDMTPIELEYYHSYYHSCAELMSPCCYEHFKIAREMLSRGIEHVDRTTCDRVVALLIKGWIEDYDPKKMNDRQLADDYRICLAYYSSIKQGKTIYKHVGDEKKPITLEDCKALALKIFKEMIKRGFTFNRPSKYKKYARELFEWLIKQVGEDKVKFKDELMDVSEIEYISPEYVSKLTDEELIELWKLLVKLAEEVATKPEDIPESIENPAIIVGNEMLKRGLWFLHSGDNILAEAVGLEVPEYPTPAGTFLSEPENVDLNTVLNLLPSNIVIDEQPYAAYLCGRIVNEGSVPKGHDIDILFRQLPDIRVVKKLKSIKPKWLADKLHIFYDPHGPLIGLSVPLFYYGFYKVPKEEMIRGFGPYRASLSKEKLKVGKPVVALKPASGFQKHEWWDTKESWLDWAHQHIEHGLFIEEKADGRRMQAHVDLEKGIVKLFTEDRKRDRSKALKPVMDEIVDILKKKGHKSVILDGEIVVYELPPNVEAKTAETKKRLGKHVPREDSVPSWTPLIIRRGGKCGEIDIIPISELAEFTEDEQLIEIDDIEVFNAKNWDTDKVWSKIKWVKRHPSYKHKILRINTVGGLVDVTDNHSILSPKGRVLKASDIKVGSKVWTIGYKHAWIRTRKQQYFIGTEDWAWFLGLFAAEGSAPRNSLLVEISNQDLDLLMKAKEIAEKHTNLTWRIRSANNCYKLSVCSKPLHELFRSWFYTKQDYLKRVPKCILNAPLNIKEKFLEGYFRGDGSNKKAYRFSGFSTNSPILATGIIWLVNQIEKRSVCVNVRNNNPYSFDINLNKGDNRKDRSLVKKIFELPYEGYLYDIETEDHTFVAGVNCKVHNTASITTGKVDPKFWNGLVYIIYDILYLDGEELVDKPYKERRKIYTELIPKRAKYLIPIPGEEAKTMQDYFRLVEKYRRIPGSEGVVVKRSDSTYPVKYKGENRTKLWGKIKNLKSIDLMVWDVIEKKTKEGKPLGQYMYIVAFEIPKEKADMFSKSRVVEYKGKTYCIIGRTYATSVKCKRGDIVTVMPIRIRKYTDKEGKIYYTFMFPYFKEKRTDKKEPDTLTIVERIARAGTAPLSVLEESDELSYEIVIDLPECEFANDKAICPLKRIFGRRRDFEYDSATELSEYTLKIQYLKYPIACPLAYIRRCVYVRPYYYGYRTYKRMSLYDEDSLELLDEVYEDEC